MRAIQYLPMLLLALTTVGLCMVLSTVLSSAVPRSTYMHARYLSNGCDCFCHSSWRLQHVLRGNEISNQTGMF